MNYKLFYFTISLLAWIPIVHAQDINSANTLRDQYKESEALTAYNNIYSSDKSNYEAIYNISYMNSRIGWRAVDATSKKTYYTRAKEFADKAIKLQPNDAESNFVMAVAMGRIAEIASAKDRVAASRDIKKFSDLAIKNNSRHAGAWHVLGKWNYRVANLSFAEEAAAKLLFGGIPDKASNDRAVECYLNAIKYGKQNMMYHYDLAMVYIKMGKKAEAKEQVKKGLTIYTMNPDNAIVRRDLEKLQKELGN